MGRMEGRSVLRLFRHASVTDISLLGNSATPPRRRRACGFRLSTHGVPRRALSARRQCKNAPEGRFCSTVRIGRIGLPPRPWQGRVLPLNHIRFARHHSIRLATLTSASARIRTWNDSFEDCCDIHFTTEAIPKYYARPQRKATW